jgi:hypothetical protein
MDAHPFTRKLPLREGFMKVPRMAVRTQVLYQTLGQGLRPRLASYASCAVNVQLGQVTSR